MASDVRTQIIGAAGEVLVTYKLLKHGIDSARLTTDDGIDLVIYSPRERKASTIQVKAAWEHRAAGGKGALTLGWAFSRDCPAEYLAVVDLSRDRAWLFTMEQAVELAQEKPASGKCRIYWYADDAKVGSSPRRESDMREYEIERVLSRIATRSATGSSRLESVNYID